MHKPVPEIEAVIFDMDGVLIHSVELHYRSWKYIADQNGLSFTREDMEGFRGRHQRDCLVRLFKGHALTEDEITAHLITKNTQYREELHKSTPDALLLPNAKNIVEAIKARGLKIGVASSSTNADYLLQHTGLYDLFDVVASGYTVTRTKPNPDVFIWAAGALRTRPTQALVFEDSAVGIQAAQTIGMFVVGIGEASVTQHAHMGYPSMQEVDLDNVFSTANAHHGHSAPSSNQIKKTYSE